LTRLRFLPVAVALCGRLLVGGAEEEAWEEEAWEEEAEEACEEEAEEAGEEFSCAVTVAPFRFLDEVTLISGSCACG
jgi:hypothetical protein